MIFYIHWCAKLTIDWWFFSLLISQEITWGRGKEIKKNTVSILFSKVEKHASTKMNKTHTVQNNTKNILTKRPTLMQIIVCPRVRITNKRSLRDVTSFNCSGCLVTCLHAKDQMIQDLLR